MEGAHITATCRHTESMQRVFRHDGQRFSVCQCWKDWHARDPKAALGWLAILRPTIAARKRAS